MASVLIFLYRKELTEFVSKHKIVSGVILLITTVTYFAIGGNTLIMLFVCMATLIYTFGYRRGNSQSSHQVSRWCLLRDLPVPHGNLSCD